MPIQVAPEALMFDLDYSGPAERLHAAIRHRDPQVAASVVRDEESGLSHVRVTFGYAGPWMVRWDGVLYQFRDRDTDPWTALSADPEEAAGEIAERLRSAHTFD